VAAQASRGPTSGPAAFETAEAAHHVVAMRIELLQPARIAIHEITLYCRQLRHRRFPGAV